MSVEMFCILCCVVNCINLTSWVTWMDNTVICHGFFHSFILLKSTFNVTRYIISSRLHRKFSDKQMELRKIGLHINTTWFNGIQILI